MKQQILIVFLLAVGFVPLFSQDCAPTPGQTCEEAPLVCGFKLSPYFGTTDGFPLTPHAPFCSNLQNNQFIKFIACSNVVTISLVPTFCQGQDGLQAAVYDNCNVMLACEKGLDNSQLPLSLSFQSVPGRVYTLMIDGFDGAICDFMLNFTGIDTSNPQSGLGGQKGEIKFTPKGCGRGTLELILPPCGGTPPSLGCVKSFADSYKDICLKYQWNLPSGVQIISSDPMAPKIEIEFVSPVNNGLVSVDLVHTCPGINPQACAECIPGCCRPTLDPLAISGFAWQSTTHIDTAVCDEDLPFVFDGRNLTDPGTYSRIYTASNGCAQTEVLHLFINCCKGKNPVLGEQCANAPLFCANYLRGQSFRLSGGSADTPGNLATGFCYTVENNKWLRFSTCQQDVSIKFTTKDCQTAQMGNPLGVEIAAFQVSNCATFNRVGDCFEVPPNTSITKAFSNLSIGQEYYLMVDGKAGSDCVFEIEPISGINEGNPDDFVTTGQVKNGSVNGPNEVCPGQMATYTATPPSCQVTTPVFNCALPTGSCALCGTGIEIKSWIYQWHIPKCARFDGDSTGPVVNIVFDQCIIDKDTVIRDTIWYDLRPVYADTVFVNGDTLVYCDCVGAVIACGRGGGMGINLRFKTERVNLTIPCTGPPPSFMGVTYPDPGIFIKNAPDGCKRYIITVTKEKTPAFNSFVTGPITCTQPVVLGVVQTTEPALIVLGNTPSGAPQTSASFAFYNPGSYTFTVSAPSGGCSQTEAFFVTMDVVPPAVTAGADLEVCGPDNISLSATASPSYCAFHWSSGGNSATTEVFVTPGTHTFTITATNLANGCTASDQVIVKVAPNSRPIQLAPLRICVGECVELPWGDVVCPLADANYQNTLTNYVGCDSIVNQKVIVSPKTTRNLGVVGTLTCFQRTVTFRGRTFNQPGKFSFPGICADTIFEIVENIAPPLVAIAGPSKLCLGESATLSATAQNGVTISWSSGQQGKDLQIKPTASSTYQCVATAPNGCTATASLSVEVNPKTVANLGIAGTLTCAKPSMVFLGRKFDQPGQFTFPGTCVDTVFEIRENKVLPQAAISGPDKLCAGETATFTAIAPANFDMLWSTGQRGAILTATPTASETLSLVVTDPDNGCSAETNFAVEVTPKTIANLGIAGTLTCAKPSMVFLGRKFDQPGQFTFPGTCVDTVFEIQENKVLPQAAISGPSRLCAGETATFTALAPANFDMLWSTGQRGAILTATPTASETFTLVVTDPDNGCSAETKFAVEVTPKTVANLGIAGTLTCAKPSMVFLGRKFDQPGQFTFPGTCVDTVFEIQENKVLPQAAISGPSRLCAGETATFTALAPANFDMLWSTGQRGAILTATPTASETLSLVVTDPDNGCSAETNFAVEVTPKTIANLGIAGTLTCAKPSMVFLGRKFDQPGQFTFPGTCVDTVFEIRENKVLPQAAISGPDKLCAGETATFTALAPANFDLLWSNGQHSAILVATPTASETLRVVVTDPTNGCSSGASLLVEVIPKTVANLGVTGTLTCAKPSMVFLGRNFDQPGQFTFAGTCVDTVFEIRENKTLPQVNITGPSSLCAGETATFTALAPSDFGLLWSNGQRGATLVAAPAGPETYRVVVTDPVNGCTSETTHSVEVAPKTVADLGVAGTLTCTQTSVTFLGRTFDHPGKFAFQGTCVDTIFEVLENALPPEIEVFETCDNSTGRYRLNVKTAPNADFTIDGIPMKQGFWQSEWLSGGNWYQIYIENAANGCKILAMGEINCEQVTKQFYIPNVLSVGKENDNGWFTVFDNSSVIQSIQSLQVYDRWGTLMFERSNFPPNIPDLGWDGYCKGKAMQPAVFIYRIALKFADNTVQWFEGDLTLVR